MVVAGSGQCRRSGRAGMRRRWRVRLALLLVVVVAGLLAAGSQAFVTHGTFLNPAVVTVPDSGPAAVYPITLPVSGLDGLVESVSVGFFVSHSTPDDLDVLLVGPTGKSVLLMSDAGGTNDLTVKELQFQDGSPPLPDSGAIDHQLYAPTNYGTGDTFPAPAPGGTPATALSTFKGTNPNGTWSLYVVDDTPGDGGQIRAFSLHIKTRLTL